MNIYGSNIAPYYIPPPVNQPVGAFACNPIMPNYAVQPNIYAQNPFYPAAINYDSAAINPKMPVSYTKLGAVQTPFGDSVHLYRLANGQKVAIMPKEGTTIVKTFVNSGSMNETDEKRGISHFIEHNLFNGSEHLAPGAFFKNATKMGASTNASTDYAKTDYYISSGFVTDESLKNTVEMHADMILRPIFPEDMVEKEKGPVTSEISMVNDDINTTSVNEVVRNLFQIQSNSKNLVAGSIKTVSALNRQDVLEYWQKHYTPDNMYTVLVGDVDPDATIDLVAKNFNQKATTGERITEKLTPSQAPVRVDFKSQVDNSSSVVAGFSGPIPTNTKDKLLFEAVGLLLLGDSTARMSTALQKINAQGGFDTQKVGLKQEDPQVLFLQVVTPKNKEQEGMDILYKSLEDIKTTPPTNDEMQVIKKSLNKFLAMNYESSESICDMIGNSFLDGDLSNIAQYQNIINSMTPNDLVNFAQQYFDLNKVSLGVVHAAGTSDSDIAASFKRSPYALKASKSNQISFGSSKPVNTDDVKELKLKDNTTAILGNSNSNLCYYNWKLTSHSSVPKNLSTPYVLGAILNHATGKGSEDTFMKKAKLLGVDLDIDTNGFSITANANSLPENAADTINMLKQGVLSPTLTKEEFITARQKAYDHFGSLNKNPSGGLVAQLYPEYFADVPKILEGLKTLTYEDVKSHWENLVNNASSTFVVSAPFNKVNGLENQVLNSMALSQGRFKDPQINLVNVHQPTRQAKVIVDTEERNQAQIFKTYSFKMSGNIQDEVKFELMNTILGGSPASRLFSNLREKEKLAYRVASEIQSFGDTGIVTMFILTTTDDKSQGDIKYDNLSKSLDGFEREAKKMQTELVSQEELDSAKMLLKQRIHREFELSESKTQLLAMNAQQPYGIKRIDEYYKAIDKMTPQDIQVAAKHVFSSSPITSVLASADTVKNQMPYLQSLERAQNSTIQSAA